MAIKPDMTKIKKRINATKNNAVPGRGESLLLATTLLTLGCKNSETQSITSENTTNLSEADTINIVLSDSQNYSGAPSSNEQISADYSIFSNINEIIDNDPSDEDTLTVITNEDIIDTPTVEGIETLVFKTSNNYTDLDNSFSIDLEKFSSFKEIILSKNDESLSIQNLELN